jgi:hypothetical protein
MSTMPKVEFRIAFAAKFPAYAAALSLLVLTLNRL